MAKLTFDTLRQANRTRQQEWPGNEEADLPFRALEFADEAGEVAGAVKKLLRARRGIHGSEKTLEDVADEIGDAMVSLDLLADELGIDIGAATARKFNKTSEKYGLGTRLPEPSN
jgi:NTP pyrophosphatase (non-canonical NTP hydrolase)